MPESNNNANNPNANKNNADTNAPSDLGAFIGNMASAAAEPIHHNIVTEYIVEERDTLSEIGRKYGVPWKEIYEANKDIIKDPDLIQPGWKLKIPKKEH